MFGRWLSIDWKGFGHTQPPPSCGAITVYLAAVALAEIISRPPAPNDGNRTTSPLPPLPGSAYPAQAVDISVSLEHFDLTSRLAEWSRDPCRFVVPCGEGRRAVEDYCVPCCARILSKPTIEPTKPTNENVADRPAPPDPPEST